MTQGTRDTPRDPRPLEQELVARGAWLIRLRWLTAAAVLLGTTAVWLVVGPTAPIVPMFAVGVSILVYNAFFWWLDRYLRPAHVRGEIRHARFASAQFLTDWAALTILVHLTGGITSPLLLFYVFHAIIASILLSPRVAALHAAIGVALVGTVTLWQVTGVLPSLPIPGFEHLPAPSAPVAGQRYFFFAVTILVVYHLSASMARRLWERTRDLLRLKERAEDAYARTRTMYDIARAATSTLDLPSVLQAIAESATAAMGAKACSIRLLDDTRTRLRISAVTGLSEAYLAKGAVEVARSPVDRTALQGWPVRVPDVATSTSLQYPEEMAREGIRSVLVVPLNLRGTAIGVLRLYSAEPRDFGDEDVGFLMAIASQGATAIENARSFSNLQALEEAKSRFVYVVAHELKAPVAAVRSALTLLAEGYGGELTEGQRPLVDRATRRVSGLSALLQDLLALGAMKGRLAQGPAEPLALATILEKVRDRVQPEVEAKGLALRLDLSPEPLSVLANPDDAERLVGNLLENAVKYTPAGGSVTVTLAREERSARMDFADTGIGIAPDALPHVFDEFYRAGNAKQQSEGTGLGLTLVRRIVEALGGTIAVESTLGTGTTFTLRLPLASGNPDGPTP